MHYCAICHRTKINAYRKTSETYQNYRQEYQTTEKYKQCAKECRETNEAKKRHREKERERRKQTKQNIIAHYSNQTMCCAICKFDDIRALSVDHIEGGGNKHRKSLNFKAGHQFYNWLVQNKFPEGFRILCMNCQFIRKAELTEATLL